MRMMGADVDVALCNDGSCPLPEAISNTTALATPNGSECEIAIALEGGSEVYGYRGTAPDGTQWQQCWDETESSKLFLIIHITPNIWC